MITINEKPVEFLRFSDGTETCQPLNEILGYKIAGDRIVVKVEKCSANCLEDLLRVILVKDALDRAYNSNGQMTVLVMPYVPHARADRVFEQGLPLPIQMVANLINGCNFDRVVIHDPHSDVTSALINNVLVKPQFALAIEEVELPPNSVVICAPDSGAAKKAFDLAAKTENEFIQASKIREVATGNIIRCEVDTSLDLNGRHVLIPDDIADGGASFIHLARKLKEKGAKEVDLFVSHGIFSKGLSVLEDDIDQIYVSNIVGDYISREEIERFNYRFKA